MLKESWNAAVESLKLDPELAQKSYAQLHRAYRANWRKYHNLAHIEALLKLSQEYQDELQKPHEVVLAIWFHDAVYQPLRTDNESRSAKLAYKFLKQAQAERASCERVCDMILNTSQHSSEEDWDDNGYFQDFDMAILGRSPEVYQFYQKNVRAEYRFVPELLYRAKRVKFLKHLLKQPFIYHMPPLRQSFEKQARENLLAELKYWEIFQD